MNIAFGFILVLGVLILVHEWGHYIVARFFGVRVDVFSIGFGPRLFGIKRGATDWRVSAVPLGGYVRMAGQDITEIDSGDQIPTGAADELMSKPRWQRALISVAGPAINLVFPIVLLTGYFAIVGDPYPKFEDNPIVIVELPKSSPLVEAGVVPGDRVTSLNSVANPTWASFYALFNGDSKPSSLKLTIEHQGESRPLDVSLSSTEHPELLFGYAADRPAISDTPKNQPAYQAGIRRGDVITSINGHPVENWNTMVDLIQHSDGKPLDIAVLRNGQPQNFSVTPTRSTDETGAPSWALGIRRSLNFSFRKVGFSQSIVSAAQFTGRNSVEVINVVGRLLTGKMSAKQLQSVIGIASESGRAVQEGTFAVIILMAGLSINLGILNLLPIPILDGGNILLLSLEGLRRRDFSLAFKERFIQVGLVFLLALFAYVMYNDVMRLFPTHS